MDKQQPALLGGLFIGVLSALPAISMGNCCCCLWVVTGGLLATYLLQGRTEGPIQTSDALVTGLLAGLIGGVVAAILNLALAPITGPLQQRMLASILERVRDMPNMPSESRTQIDEIMRQTPANVPLALRLGQSAIFAGISSVMAMLGALLGVAFFRKKMPAPPVQG
jgi:hypothetical protein